ncbi:extracellular solute-binding protein [Paraburkholderia silviterrae]|nr:extracellular solute-binding protein [Paraburkholderia silviterrae]
MRADDRLATLAVIDRVSDILRDEFADRALDIWPILAALLRQHQQGQSVTVTALADSSGMPRTSARRVVFALKAQGWLALRAVSASGKRTVVVPSAALVDSLDRITEQTVKLMAGSRDPCGLDRFACANLDRDKGIPWPLPAEEGFDDTVVLTLVAYEDPVFDILKRHRADIDRFMGHRVRVLTFAQNGYPAALGRVLAERSTIQAAAPLLVAIPLLWVADVSANGRLLDLRALLAESACCGDDFYDAVWRAGWVGGQCYGMPLQPTVEFLWYRQDLFDAEGLTPPRSLDEVIRCAARLHRPRIGRTGISWSSAPGLPLAESFLQMLGAQRGVGVDDGMLQVDADAGTPVIEYLRALRAYAPAQWCDVNWARNAQLFGAGKAAMGHHWSNRYGMLDSHALLQKGRPDRAATAPDPRAWHVTAIAARGRSARDTIKQ